MGRLKKKEYTASAEFLRITEGLIHRYPELKAFCDKYEESHGAVLDRLNLRDVYCPTKVAFVEPCIQYSARGGREKDALEDYMDAKKQVYLLEHYVGTMEDEQMRAVAVVLFLEGVQQKNAEVFVEGRALSQRTICREKKRALRCVAESIEAYALWEAERLFDSQSDKTESEYTDKFG